MGYDFFVHKIATLGLVQIIAGTSRVAIHKTAFWGDWGLFHLKMPFSQAKGWKGQGGITFLRQQISKTELIITRVSPLPQRSREITQRSHLSAHQALERLPEDYEIIADGRAAGTEKRSRKTAFKLFSFLFSISGGSMLLPSCVNLFTIP